MSRKKPYDAGDPEQVKAERKVFRSEQAMEAHDLGIVLKLIEGRAALWRVLEKCGVFDSSYRGDPHAMVYQEGQRKIGLTILADINNADPNAFVRMLSEHRERQLKKEVSANG